MLQNVPQGNQVKRMLGKLEAFCFTQHQIDTVTVPCELHRRPGYLGAGHVPAVAVPTHREEGADSGPDIDHPRSRSDPLQQVQTTRPHSLAPSVVFYPTGVERRIGIRCRDLSLRRPWADKAVTAPHAFADVGCRGEGCDIASPTSIAGGDLF